MVKALCRKRNDATRMLLYENLGLSECISVVTIFCKKRCFEN